MAEELIIRKCSVCGEEFIPEHFNQKICKRTHYFPCPICGKPVEYKNNNPNRCCSAECIKEKCKQTSLEHYGTEHPCQSTQIKEKTAATNIAKYGVKAPAQVKEIHDRQVSTYNKHYGKKENPKGAEALNNKKKATAQEKYGCDYYMQTAEFKEKSDKTCKEKYGIEHSWEYAGTEEGQAKIKNTCKEIYGVENAMQADSVKDKCRQTCKEHYGTENYAQSSDYKEHKDEYNKRRYNTNKKLYGTEHYAQSQDWQENFEEYTERKIQTTMEKYGAPHYAQSQEWQEKQDDYIKKNQETCLERYGETSYSKTDKFKEQMKEISNKKYGVDNLFLAQEFKEKAMQTCLEQYGVPYFCMTDKCRDANGFTKSKVNKKFGELLDQKGIEYTIEYSIDRYSYDFRLMKQNILLEINPTVTHNAEFSIFDKKRGGKDKKYHLDKTLKAEENGYRCIHIFDWDDKEKVIDMFMPTQVIYARECEVRETEPQEAGEFITKYHLQGNCRNQQKCLGLYYKDTLVEAMSFGTPRYNKNYEYELLRLCTKTGYSIIGGASKLFAYFINIAAPHSIISYCDRAKFTGDVYTKMGMRLKEETAPNKVWSKKDKYITNNLLLQYGYDKLFKTNYGKGTSNEQLMLDNGWLPIYDCGQKVFEWEN